MVANTTQMSPEYKYLTCSTGAANQPVQAGQAGHHCADSLCPGFIRAEVHGISLTIRMASVARRPTTGQRLEDGSPTVSKPGSSGV